MTDTKCSDIWKLKSEAEQKILDILREFNKNTHLIVDDIELSHLIIPEDNNVVVRDVEIIARAKRKNIL